MFSDEMQLHKNMEGPSISAAAEPSRDVSFETMIFGLLTKHILPNATVVGFSRTGDFINREYLNSSCEIYNFKELSWEDVTTFIEKTTESEELREQIRQQLEEIDEDLGYEMLFLKEIVKIAQKGNIHLEEKKHH